MNRGSTQFLQWMSGCKHWNSRSIKVWAPALSSVFHLFGAVVFLSISGYRLESPDYPEPGHCLEFAISWEPRSACGKNAKEYPQLDNSTGHGDAPVPENQMPPDNTGKVPENLILPDNTGKVPQKTETVPVAAPRIPCLKKKKRSRTVASPKNKPAGKTQTTGRTAKGAAEEKSEPAIPPGSLPDTPDRSPAVSPQDTYATPQAISPPVPLYAPPPKYPRHASKMRKTGRVVLLVEVLPSGEPGQIDIEISSLHRQLDCAAVEAIRTWRFRPACQNGKSIRSWLHIPVDFRIPGRSE